MRSIFRSYFDQSESTEIYFRIIRYNPVERLVIVDFIDSIELGKIDTEIYSSLEFGTPSMIVFQNYNHKRVQEGSCYPIKRALLFELVGNATRNENSFVIRYNVILNTNIPEIFGKSKTFTFEEIMGRGFYTYGEKLIEDIPKYNGPKYDLLVKNVGQGNWNELYSNKKCEFIYDIGTSMFYSREKVIEMSSGSHSMIKADKPGLIVSHWDIDHYHCLFAMDDDVIKSFGFIICPSFSPTLSSRLILSKFKQLCSNNLFTFEFEKSDLKTSFNPLAPFKRGKIIFFFGHYHRDRNKCGVVIAINLQNKGAILTGDHFYNQISNCVLPELNSLTHCLIVPHHGGKAGDFDYKLNPYQKVTEAVISVGLNPYGHPSESNITQLKKIGFKIYQTRFKGTDIKIELN
jgi:hypothetical protein